MADKMATVADAYSGPDCCYFGDRQDWIIAASTHRDADTITRANYQAMATRLADCNGDDYAEESFSHWLVGHGDYLIVRPGTEAEAIAREAEAAMKDYPVLDDEVLSDLEHDDVVKLAKCAAMDYGYGSIDDAAGYQIARVAFNRDGRDNPGYAGVDDYYPSRSVVFAGVLHARRAMRVTTSG